MALLVLCFSAAAVWMVSEAAPLPHGHNPAVTSRILALILPFDATRYPLVFSPVALHSWVA